MCDIPLDLQRKFEQRWASRFARPVPPVAPERHSSENQPEHLAAPVEAERKTRVEAAGLRPSPAV